MINPPVVNIVATMQNSCAHITTLMALQVLKILEKCKHLKHVQILGSKMYKNISRF